MPRIHVTRIPIRMDAFTFLIYKIAVTINPINASRAQIPSVCQFSANFTPDNNVDSFDTTICAPCNPINAINRPIPALTPFLSVVGIALKIASRTFVSESTIKIIPSINTAISATCQEYPIVSHTVYAKYAFNPIPGANANG